MRRKKVCERILTIKCDGFHKVFIRKYKSTESPLTLPGLIQINISSCFPESLSAHKYLLYFIFHTRFTEACSMT